MDINSSKKRKLWIFIVLLDTTIIALLVIYFGIFQKHVNIKIKGTYLENPFPITEFNLVDDKGQSFTRSQLQGHWTLIFFGFTHCPVICPTTMSALNIMYKKLQQRLPPKQLPLVIFISVDPRRDTQEKLHHFIDSFNTNFVGLRTTIDAVNRLEKQLHITISTNNLTHSTDILLVNPAVNVQAYLSYPHTGEQLAADYQRILKITASSDA